MDTAFANLSIGEKAPSTTTEERPSTPPRPIKRRTPPPSLRYDPVRSPYRQALRSRNPAFVEQLRTGVSCPLSASHRRFDFAADVDFEFNIPKFSIGRPTTAQDFFVVKFFSDQATFAEKIGLNWNSPNSRNKARAIFKALHMWTESHFPPWASGTASFELSGHETGQSFGPTGKGYTGERYEFSFIVEGCKPSKAMIAVKMTVGRLEEGEKWATRRMNHGKIWFDQMEALAFMINVHQDAIVAAPRTAE